MIVLAHLARLLGICFIFYALFKAIAYMAGGDVLAASVFWGGVAAGLMVAVLGDRAIDRLKKQYLDSAQERALAFSAHTLTIQPRWVHLSLFLVFFGFLSFVLFAGARSVFSTEKFAATAVFGALGLAVVAGIASLLTTLHSAIRSGYLVQLDGLGFEVWGNQVIPWRQVAGVDLKETNIKGRKRYDLVLALWPNRHTPEKSQRLVDKLHWSAPLLDQKANTLSIPCTFLNIEPQTFAQAAKAIGDQFNSTRLNDWRYFESVECAVSRARQRENFEKEMSQQMSLLTRLKAIDKNAEIDPIEIGKIDRDMQLSMERTRVASSMSAVQAEAAIANIKSQYTKLKCSVMLVLFASIGIFSLIYFFR